MSKRRERIDFMAVSKVCLRGLLHLFPPALGKSRPNPFFRGLTRRLGVTADSLLRRRAGQNIPTRSVSEGFYPPSLTLRVGMVSHAARLTRSASDGMTDT